MERTAHLRGVGVGSRTRGLDRNRRARCDRERSALPSEGSRGPLRAIAQTEPAKSRARSFTLRETPIVEDRTPLGEHK
jgi:hypothetical protein